MILNEEDISGQGGCIVGDKFYQAYLLDQTAGTVRLVEYDLATGDVLRTSDPYYYDKENEVQNYPVLWHANAMTYNPDLNCLVVCPCATVHYNEIYLVSLNEETFFEVTMVSLKDKTWCTDKAGAGNIHYNANKKQYAITRNSTAYIDILDENFDSVAKYRTETAAPKGVTTGTQGQEIYCDDNFIYCIFYDSANKTKENTTVTQVHAITVFDWDGNRVKEIQFSLHPDDVPDCRARMTKNPYATVLKNEPESIDFIDGKFYIAFNCQDGVNGDNGYEGQLLCTLEISN